MDFNNDGQVDFGEKVFTGVTVTLAGTDNPATPSTKRSRPMPMASTYRPAAEQCAGLHDPGIAAGGLSGRPGHARHGNGVAVGNASVNNVFSGVAISQSGSLAENYNFGERPATNGGVTAGQTAGIGFWQNNNGQNLIKALNGGATATQLGHWLAVTFPNMYANLDGMTNSGVAAFYKTLFARNANSAPGGPPKTDAQVMATALAVYVTNQSLAGTTAAACGFQ